MSRLWRDLAHKTGVFKEYRIPHEKPYYLMNPSCDIMEVCMFAMEIIDQCVKACNEADSPGTREAEYYIKKKFDLL